MSAEKSKCVRTSDFIGFTAHRLRFKLSGAEVAIDCVGQRDTRWLTPLTVSGGYQGEEGNHQILGACSYPTAASAFYIFGLGAFTPAKSKHITTMLPALIQITKKGICPFHKPNPCSSSQTSARLKSQPPNAKCDATDMSCYQAIC